MKKIIAAVLILLFALLPAGLFAEEPYTPVGEVFQGVHAPYLLAGGLPSQTEFFTDEQFYEYRLTLLNLWDSNCANCRIELPFFERAYETYHNEGLNIVGAATQILGGTYEHCWELIEENRLLYPQVFADSGIMAVASNCYFVPQTYFIDRTGTVVAFYGGFADYRQMEGAILSLIVIPGDADCDEVVTFADVSTVSAFLEGAGSLSTLGEYCADVNGDSRVNISDLTDICALLIDDIK